MADLKNNTEERKCKFANECPLQKDKTNSSSHCMRCEYASNGFCRHSWCVYWNKKIWNKSQIGGKNGSNNLSKK